MAARFHKLYPPGVNAPDCSTVEYYYDPTLFRRQPQC